MQQSLILKQIIYLAILVIIGVIASRARIIKSETRDSLVKVIFNITLPLLLLTNFSKLDLTPEILRNSILVIVLSIVVMLLMMGVGYLFSRFFNTGHEQRSVFIVHHAFGNILYFGFPVVSALFGELGLFYASIYTFGSIMLLWTLGVYVITRNGKMSFRENLKRMINPNSVAILLGFILFLLKIKLPAFLLEPFRNLGGTTIYLSMLYIGALLGLIPLKGLFTSRMSAVTALNKNFLLPFLLILIFAFTRGNIFSGVDNLILAVVVMEASMPCMANIVIVAKIFDVDDQLATSNVFLSTILSMASLPIIYYLLNLFVLT